MNGDASGVEKSTASPAAGTIGLAVGVGLVAIVLSQAIEIFINRVLRPDTEELTWISESLMAAGFLIVTSLWVRLRQTRLDLSASERARVAVETQISVAASVQRALLPPIPDPIAGVVWFASVEPAGKIGGDYYDFIRRADGRMWVVLGDVSGKGIPAAVFLSSVRAVVRALVRDAASPDDVLGRLSEAVSADSGTELYVTCLLALVDPEHRTFTYANAGHPAGVLVSRSGVRSLSIGGPPAGLLPSPRYRSEVVPFADGDIVALVSDGVTDALDVGGNAVADALAAVIAAGRSRTPQDVCVRLLEAAREGTGPSGLTNWTDDRTVVAFGIPSAS